ncbi:MAG: GNAT family N-acetyltransferase [Candidatus Moranbacteria bacterium]|nr:GNAT family N-acetyltransferase [Candidatus Moranbacteria bacterium]
MNKFFIAREVNSGRVTGFVNLTDTPMDYFGVELKSCELSIVATDPEFQGKGISNSLTEDFMKEIEKCEYTSIFIQGIPNFYRRYGFDYAIPMKNMIIDDEKISGKSKFGDKNGTEIVKATLADTEFIFDCCSNFRKEYPGIYKYRTIPVIRSSISEYTTAFTKKEYFIIKSAGERIGYFCLNSDTKKLLIEEVSEMNFAVYEKVIEFSKKLRPDCAKIQVNLPQKSSMVTYLKTFEKKEHDFSWGNYSFQIKIPDLFLFLNETKKVLEHRIRNSAFKNENVEFSLNNYSQCIKVRFENGKLSFEKLSPWKLTWDCNLPYQVLVKIIFGDSSANELQSMYPDTIIQPEYKEFFAVLFPKVDAHIYCNY